MPPAGTRSRASTGSDPRTRRRGRDRDRDRGEEQRECQRQGADRTSSRCRADTVLIRRMHGIVAIVLWQLRAGADWGAIAGEYLHGAPPATALGEAEADFLGSGADPVRQPA